MPWRNQILSEEQKQSVASRQATPEMVIDILSGKYAQDGRYVSPKIIKSLMGEIAGATDKEGDNPYITNLEQLGHTYDPAWFTNYIKPGAVSSGTHQAVNNYLTNMGPVYGYEEPYALMDQYNLRSGIPLPATQRYLDSLDMQRAAIYNREQFNPITRQWQPLDQDILDQIDDGRVGLKNWNFSVDPSVMDNHATGISPQATDPITLTPQASSLPGTSDSPGQSLFSRIVDAIIKGLPNVGSDTSLPILPPEQAEHAINTAGRGVRAPINLSGNELSNSVSAAFLKEANDFGLTPPEYEKLISTVTSLVEKNKNNPTMLSEIFKELTESGLSIQVLDSLRPNWWLNLRKQLTQGFNQ